MLRSELHRLIAAVASVALVGAVALGAAPPARAATHAVGVGDGFFSPASLTIAVGDTVAWTNGDDSPHTVTADGGVFDSGNLDGGATFTFTFTEPGPYRYVCLYHEEMVGTITVVAGDGDASTAVTTTAGAAAPPAAATTAPPPSAATAAAHGTGHGDQPDTALPIPTTPMPWLATLLIGLGLLAFSVALFPPRGHRAEVLASRKPGGWRR